MNLKYKGLVIPNKSKDASLFKHDGTHEGRQTNVFCNRCDCWDSISCQDCLFSYHNIKPFKQWLKFKRKERKRNHLDRN